MVVSVGRSTCLQCCYLLISKSTASSIAYSHGLLKKITMCYIMKNGNRSCSRRIWSRMGVECAVELAVVAVLPFYCNSTYSHCTIIPLVILQSTNQNHPTIIPLVILHILLQILLPFYCNSTVSTVSVGAVYRGGRPYRTSSIYCTTQGMWTIRWINTCLGQFIAIEPLYNIGNQSCGGA